MRRWKVCNWHSLGGVLQVEDQVTNWVPMTQITGGPCVESPALPAGLGHVPNWSAQQLPGPRGALQTERKPGQQGEPTPSGPGLP